MHGAKAMNALKVAALGAATGQSDLEDTTNALAAAWKSGIRGAGNMRHAMAILNATAGAGNMRMADLAKSFSSGLLPAAKSANVSLSQLGGAMALLADEGTKPQQAATRLRMSLSLLAAPSKTAAKVLHHIGLSGTKLATAMQGPGGLIAGLAVLKHHLESLTRVQKMQVLSHAFGGGRSGGTILALVDGLDKLRQKYQQVSKSASHFNQDVAATQETAAYKLKSAWSSVQVALIKFGAAIAPTVERIAGWLARLADRFSKLPASAQTLVTVGALGVAALGPIVWVGGNLVRVLTAMRIAYTALAGVFAAKTAAVNAAGVAMQDFRTAEEGALTATLGLGPAIVALGAVAIAGFVVAATIGASKTDVLAGAFNQAKGAVDGLAGAIHHATAAQQAATAADHQRTAAQIAVKVAQKNVNRLTRQSKRGTLEYKQAVNEVNLAQDNLRTASASAALAQQKQAAEQKRARRVMQGAKSAMDKLTAAAHHHITATQQDSARLLRGRDLIKNRGDAATTASGIVRNYARKMDGLSASYDQAAGRLRKSNPILSQNMKHLSIVAQTAAEVARTSTASRRTSRSTSR